MKQIQLQKRIKITEENHEIVRRNPHLIPSTFIVKTASPIKEATVEIPYSTLATNQRSTNSINRTIKEATVNIPYNEFVVKNSQTIEFLDATTNQAIQHYLKLNPTFNVAILNFANSHKPCADYLYGSTQEEVLCRASGFLYASLNNRRTDYDNWGDKWDSQVWFTPNVPFHRSDTTEKLLGLEDQYTASVISSELPDLHDLTDKKRIPSKAQYEKTIRLIHNIPKIVKQTDPTVLILGAWGCGIFAPESMPEYNTFIANLFYQVLASQERIYDKICFAIPKKFGGNNYDAFLKVFEANSGRFESVTEISLISI